MQRFKRQQDSYHFEGSLRRGIHSLIFVYSAEDQEELIIYFGFYFNVKKMPKTNKKWPRSVNEAVEKLIAEMSEEDKKILMNTPEEELFKYHFGLGMYIRNKFGLWQGNKDLLESCFGKGYFHDPDEASSFIIRALWKRLQNN